jgi:hypothetical protein
MRKALLSTVFILSVALSGSSWAGGGDVANNNTNNNNNTNTSVNSNLNNNLNLNNNNNVVDLVNKNNISQSQNQASFNLNRNNGDRNDVRVTTAPNLSGLVAAPHTCMGSVTVSGGGGGLVSLGVGSTYRDRECDLREAVKLAAQLGLTQEAVRLFQELEVVRSLNNKSNTVTTQTTSGVDTVVRDPDSPVATRTTLVDWWYGRR